MANPDAKGTPSPPPNLRVSAEEDKECDGCKMFISRGAQEPFDGRCTGYSLLPVCGEWVCDSWAPAASQDEEEREDQPKSLSDARIKVREHFRRARNQRDTEDAKSE